MRILHVIPTMDVGGAQRQLLYVLSGLPRDRFRSEVAILYEAGAWARELDRLGIVWGAVRAKHVKDARAVWRVSRLIKRRRFDVVFTWMFDANTMGRAAAFLAGQRRVIASVRNLETWKRPRHIAVDRLLARWTWCIVANSHASMRYAARQARIPASRFRVIHNGIDTARFARDRHPSRCRSARRTVRAEFHVPARAPLLIMVARLHPQKGLARLFAAMRDILHERPEARLLLVGDGPLRVSLRKQVEDFGMAERVLFAGGREDVPSLLWAADVFVLPSLREGMPNAVLEAMAAGLPVVATRVGGTPECVADGESGLLVPPDDSHALAHAVLRLLGSARMRARLGAAARERVCAHFGTERLVQRMTALLDEAGGQHGA